MGSALRFSILVAPGLDRDNEFAPAELVFLMRNRMGRGVLVQKRAKMCNHITFTW